MGTRVKVELTDEQAATLRMWAGSGKTEQRLALRARVVLLAADGLGLKEIEGKSGLNWQSCLKWRKRFLARGLEGLKDQVGRGRPTVDHSGRACGSRGSGLHHAHRR